MTGAGPDGSVNLVQGNSALGVIRIACAEFGLAGEATAIADDLSHGPLRDGVERLDYMRSCYRGCDAWLLEVCSTRWQPAARVVGCAMRRCDEHNRLSDLFFSFRLQHLIDSGRLECRGERRRLRDHDIRLPER